MQLQFRCPQCRTSGLTPELDESKAIAVAMGHMNIKCPTCFRVVEVDEPDARVLWRARKGLIVDLMELAREALSNPRETPEALAFNKQLIAELMAEASQRIDKRWSRASSESQSTSPNYQKPTGGKVDRTPHAPPDVL